MCEVTHSLPITGTLHRRTPTQPHAHLRRQQAPILCAAGEIIRNPSALLLNREQKGIQPRHLVRMQLGWAEAGEFLGTAAEKSAGGRVRADDIPFLRIDQKRRAVKILEQMGFAVLDVPDGFVRIMKIRPFALQSIQATAGLAEASTFGQGGATCDARTPNPPASA